MEEMAQGLGSAYGILCSAEWVKEEGPVQYSLVLRRNQAKSLYRKKVANTGGVSFLAFVFVFVLVLKIDGFKSI